jgi:hypothetical protein
MKKTVIILLLSTFMLTSCKAQSGEEKKVYNTSSKVLETIKSGNSGQFQDLIGVQLRTIGKDKSYVRSDYEDMKEYYDQYIKTGKPKIVITDEFDELERRKVVIPFYKGKKDSKGILLVELQLFFGPPRFVPLDKLSGYQLIVRKTIDDFPEAPRKIN